VYKKYTTGCDRLRSWLRAQGLGEQSSARALLLLHAEFLLNQSRPEHWDRSGEFSIAERCRYYWHRHVAQLLRWEER
jgi:hypothetical protein